MIGSSLEFAVRLRQTRARSSTAGVRGLGRTARAAGDGAASRAAREAPTPRGWRRPWPGPRPSACDRVFVQIALVLARRKRRANDGTRLRALRGIAAETVLAVAVRGLARQVQTRGHALPEGAVRRVKARWPTARLERTRGHSVVLPARRRIGSVRGLRVVCQRPVSLSRLAAASGHADQDKRLGLHGFSLTCRSPLAPRASTARAAPAVAAVAVLAVGSRPS